MTDWDFMIMGLLTGLTLGGIVAAVKTVLPPGRH